LLKTIFHQTLTPTPTQLFSVGVLFVVPSGEFWMKNYINCLTQFVMLIPNMTWVLFEKDFLMVKESKNAYFSKNFISQ
jgi:hypothetical protein